MKWISIKKQKPTPKEMVVAYKKTQHDGFHVIEVGKRLGKEFHSAARYVYPMSDFSHWMPLPLPPESPND